MNWCTDLPAGNIYSFEDLRKRFLESFSNLVTRRVNIGILLTIKQVQNRAFANMSPDLMKHS